MQHRKSKKSNPYKEVNEAFLKDKSKEEGVVVLDNGVMYRVLEEGSGSRKPTPRSIVYVHYTGRLIDGTVFDSTEGDSPRPIAHLSSPWNSSRLNDEKASSYPFHPKL